MQTFTERKIIKKGLRHGAHCYRPYMCGGGGLTGETYSTAEVSVHQVYIIRYNITSCSSVAFTLKGLAGLEQRTKKFFEQVVLRCKFDASEYANSFQYFSQIKQ